MPFLPPNYVKTVPFLKIKFSEWFFAIMLLFCIFFVDFSNFCEELG